MKFPGDNVCERVLIADNVNETGKIKTLQITESVHRRSDTVIHDVKGKKTSSSSWYWGIPPFQYVVRSDPPTSNHKSVG